MSEYLVIYEQADDGGWGAYLPDLPGVAASDFRSEFGSRGAGSSVPSEPSVSEPVTTITLCALTRPISIELGGL